jgi:hypothetical protein
MIFKPRIFISSTLSENLRIRTKIENFYSRIGAEVMLYERNLTPSVTPMTYRRDILDADFVILIIKSQYGKRTENGISGTHEEFQIALESNIPMHVYIKLSNGTTAAQELIDEINKNHICYFYFKNDAELLTRIKETTFTIAKEIMLKNVETAKLPTDSVIKIAIKHDYDKAIEFVKIVKSMQKAQEISSYNYIDSTLFSAFLLSYAEYKASRTLLFVDNKLETMVTEMMEICIKFFRSHSLDFTSIVGSEIYFEVPVIGKTIVQNGSMCSHPQLSRTKYQEMIDCFFKKYKKFVEYIKNRKFILDTML